MSMSIKREDAFNPDTLEFWAPAALVPMKVQVSGIRSNYKNHCSCGQIQRQGNKLRCHCANPGNNENILLKWVHEFDAVSLDLKVK